MDENEIKAVAEAMNQLRETGTIASDTMAKLGGTTQSANKALEGYSKKMLGAAGAVGGMATAVAQGEGSFKSLGGTIVGLTSVVGKLASALPLVGGAAKALAEGVGEAAKFVLDQLDVMARNYQTLGDASAGAADGVDGLLRQFNQMGNFSLPAFTKAVRANALGLSALSGTAAQGAEELSKISGALTTGDTANRFLKLGIGLDAVGEATTEYLATSARYGILQGATTEELTKKTQNYIEEVDKIARLTGQSREAQAKEAQKSLADAKFRAKIADMQASGQGEQAQQLRQYVEGLGGAAGDAARALVTGIPLTKEAAQANLFTNDALRQNVIAIQAGKKSTEAITDTQQAMVDGTKRFGKQIMYAGDMAGGMAVQAFDQVAIVEEQNKLMATGLTREQAIAAVQKKQMTASGKTTQEFTDAQLATAGASKNLQSLGFSLAETAIPAVESFASGLEQVTDFIDKRFGIGGTKTTRPGVNRGTRSGREATDEGNRVVGSAEARGKAESYLGRKIDDKEFSDLIKATHAESAAGKQSNQQEQAMIMASILNRARDKNANITDILKEKNQFQAVTGTKYDPGPSKQFLQGPGRDRQRSIEGATDYLDKISRQQKNFTAESAAAYGKGTNIGYRDNMLAAGGTRLGGSIFNTAGPTDTTVSGPRSGYKPSEVANATPVSDRDNTQTQAQSNRQAALGAEAKFEKTMAELVALQRQSNATQAQILKYSKS